jgi:hypothetical protein
MIRGRWEIALDQCVATTFLTRLLFADVYRDEV